MKLAIMQPYFLPYLGYWQLLYHVDRFVVYDDVNYIKRGWVNRNRILMNGNPTYITVPVRGGSQNRKISDLPIDDSVNWRGKMIRTVEMAYKKAPFFPGVYPLIEEIIGYRTGSLADFLRHQMIRIATFLDIDTDVVESSLAYGNADLNGQSRIIDICQREGADCYVNPVGGRELYRPQDFRRAGLTLKFLEMKPVAYDQRAPAFHSNLSIVDVLMQVGLEGMDGLLREFELRGA